MNELIRKRGFRLGAVAEAIGVSKNTISRWTDNAPIGKLIQVSDFTGIPLIDVVESFRYYPDPVNTDLTTIDPAGGQNN